LGRESTNGKKRNNVEGRLRPQFPLDEYHGVKKQSGESNGWNRKGRKGGKTGLRLVCSVTPQSTEATPEKGEKERRSLKGLPKAPEKPTSKEWFSKGGREAEEVKGGET